MPYKSGTEKAWCKFEASFVSQQIDQVALANLCPPLHELAQARRS